MSDKQMILMGQVSGLFGVRGWVKIHSYTNPRAGILDYSPWYLKKESGWEAHEVLTGRLQGKSLVAHLKGYDDRDRAADLLKCDIAIRREQLPELGEDEFYWNDLQGLRVVNLEGVELGRVSHLFETGANAVLVVEGDRERLIPYTKGETVRKVDLDAGLMIVDWDPEF